MTQIDDLTKFLNDINEDVNSMLEAQSEEGGNPTQIFTQIALEYLGEVGEAENTFLCFDEKISNRGTEHRINAYSISETYDTLNLYVTKYAPDNMVRPLTKAETDRLINLGIKFFENAYFRMHYKNMEESAEAFELVHTLSKEKKLLNNLSRITVTLITNGLVKRPPQVQKNFEDISTIVRVVDIEYLYNISDKEHSPIIVGQDLLGVPLPCISSNLASDGYQSYLAIIPGASLASIYETYGLRLLENNVRSFLQFTGKINKGIRNTILSAPHMFLAYNNGISVTAGKIDFCIDENRGKSITEINDFQIVNGGQTTSALFHVWKKDKASIQDVYVPMKITVLEPSENDGEIVAKIAEYANTQNKISISDLSANKESLVMLETISRNTWAPALGGGNQTRWFFERARGQYKNERSFVSRSSALKKKFEIQNPSKQIITKELLAKYVNSWDEVKKGVKTLIGPNVVVRGSQKNFQQFLIHNCPQSIDETFFKKTVSKAILFKTLEKIYGVKPNAIGDLRYIIVPYTMSLISFKTNAKFNLMKVWKEQSISEELHEPIKALMIKVEDFIKSEAPGSLYGEWAKNEDCWKSVKEHDFIFDYSLFDGYCIEEKAKTEFSYNDDSDRKEREEEIKHIGVNGWENLLVETKGTGITDSEDARLIKLIIHKLKEDITFSPREIYRASYLLYRIQNGFFKNGDVL